jgi:regulatory protein
MTSGPSRKPKKVSAEYLQRAAFHYLGRFASSRRNLERVLERKVRRRHGDFTPASDEETGWIIALAEKCEALGLVDDRQYATQKARSMQRAGRSTRRIRGELNSRGVGEDDISAALAALREAMDGLEDGEDVDCVAAITFARRRKFGPFGHLRLGVDRLDPDTRARRELAAFARAGFAYELARKILTAETEEELEGI